MEQPVLEDKTLNCNNILKMYDLHNFFYFKFGIQIAIKSIRNEV